MLTQSDMRPNRSGARRELPGIPRSQIESPCVEDSRDDRKSRSRGVVIANPREQRARAVSGNARTPAVGRGRAARRARVRQACIRVHFFQGVRMTKHLDRTVHGPLSLVYALSTSRRSFIAAGAQRATQDFAARNKHSDERSALERWEGEGGAVAAGAKVRKSTKALRTYAAMSSRPSYDSPHRSIVEAMLNASTAASASSPVGANRGPTDGKRRSMGSQKAPSETANPLNKRRGRRTMGRHGNRP